MAEGDARTEATEFWKPAKDQVQDTEATVFGKHAKGQVKDRRGPERLTPHKVVAALRRPHEKIPDDGDPNCTKHFVRIKEQDWIVVTGRPRDSFTGTEWFEQQGVYLDDEDEFIITVYKRDD